MELKVRTDNILRTLIGTTVGAGSRYAFDGDITRAEAASRYVSDATTLQDTIVKALSGLEAEDEAMQNTIAAGLTGLIEGVYPAVRVVGLLYNSTDDPTAIVTRSDRKWGTLLTTAVKMLGSMFEFESTRKPKYGINIRRDVL